MKENIKELKKGLFQGLGILIILSVGGLTFWLVKSRTATDPGLGDNGSSLYTNVNETLTAAKRNALVKSTKREDVSTSDTTTLFDMNCERRFKVLASSDGNLIFYYPFVSLGGQRIFANTQDNYWYINHIAKSTIVTNNATIRTLQKLQKRCQ